MPEFKNLARFKKRGGEICVANFIPPANGASLGNYFQAKIPKMAVFEFFSPFCSTSPEIIGFKFDQRQTDRQIL